MNMCDSMKHRKYIRKNYRKEKNDLVDFIFGLEKIGFLMVKYLLKPDEKKRDFNQKLVYLYSGERSRNDIPEEGMVQKYSDIVEDLWQILDTVPFRTENKKLEATSNKIESGGLRARGSN